MICVRAPALPEQQSTVQSRRYVIVRANYIWPLITLGDHNKRSPSLLEPAWIAAGTAEPCRRVGSARRPSSVAPSSTRRCSAARPNSTRRPSPAPPTSGGRPSSAAPGSLRRPSPATPGSTGAAFLGYARFDEADFAGYARFNAVTFTGLARFGSATFNRGTAFDRATFTGDGQFKGANALWLFTARAGTCGRPPGPPGLAGLGDAAPRPAGHGGSG